MVKINGLFLDDSDNFFVFQIKSYNVGLDCPVGNVTINGSQTLRNRNPACGDVPGPIGMVLIIGNVCVGEGTEIELKSIFK